MLFLLLASYEYIIRMEPNKSLKPHFWDVLSKRNFRLMWVASLLSYVGHSAESVVFGWWVMELTNSPMMLGIVFSWSRFSRWLGPVFGVISDRYDRKKLWIIFLIGDVILYFLMGVLCTFSSDNSVTPSRSPCDADQRVCKVG